MPEIFQQDAKTNIQSNIGVLMPNKKYIKGANFERKIKKLYESYGYLVIRSSGSHGVADLVAFPPLSKIDEWQPILMQCKNTTKVYLPEDMKELKYVAEKYGLRAALISNSKGKDLITWIVTK
jgi:Holliday junction resolvase